MTSPLGQTRREGTEHDRQSNTDQQKDGTTLDQHKEGDTTDHHKDGDTTWDPKADNSIKQRCEISELFK